MSANEGFLSAEFANTVARIRRDFSTWFQQLENANRFAMEVLPCLRPGTTDNQKVLEAAFYGKAVQSVQAVVLLAERGMTGDARTILRGCVETAILQRKLSQDVTFVDKLMERHDYHRRAMGNALLHDKKAMAEVPPDEIRKLRTAIEEIDARYPDRRPADINLADIAVSVDGMALYNIFFRSMSGDAAHGTLDSIARHITTDSVGEMTGLTFGPRVEDLAATLSAAISVLLHVLDSAIESFALAEFRPRLADCLVAWKAIVVAR